MVHLQIDPHSGVPVYRQVMDQVKYYVASGALGTGAQLPSIRHLARRLAVNPTTIVKAYNELAHEGVIEMKHGKGAFVAARGRVLSAGEMRKALGRLARQLAVEAAQMGAADERVVQIVREQMEALRDGRTGD